MEREPAAVRGHRGAPSVLRAQRYQGLWLSPDLGDPPDLCGCRDVGPGNPDGGPEEKPSGPPGRRVLLGVGVRDQPEIRSVASDGVDVGTGGTGSFVGYEGDLACRSRPPRRISQAAQARVAEDARQVRSVDRDPIQKADVLTIPIGGEDDPGRRRRFDLHRSRRLRLLPFRVSHRRGDRVRSDGQNDRERPSRAERSIPVRAPLDGTREASVFPVAGAGRKLDRLT